MPTYNKPAVQEQGFRAPQLSLDIPSAARSSIENTQQVQRASQGVADTIFKIADREKQVADDSVVKDSVSRAVKKKNELLHAKGGVYSQKGESAFGALDYFDTEFKKYSDEEHANLNNDVQRSQYKNALSQISTEANGNINSYMFAQRKVVQENAMKFGLEANREDAVLNFMNPGKVQSSINQQKALVLAWSQDNGIDQSSDQFKIMMGDVDSKTHSQVIQRMVDSDQDLMADEYFKTHKSLLLSDDLIRTEKIVEAGTLKMNSQGTVDKLLSDPEMKKTSALVEINKIEDVKLRDETKRRYENDYAAKERAEQADQNTLFDTVSKVLEQTGGLDSVPKAQRTALSISQNSALESREAQLKSGKTPVTDWSQYYNLKTMASIPQTSDEFVKLNLGEYRPMFADAQFKELVDIQTSMRSKDGKSEKILSGIRTKDQIVKDVMNAAGIDKKDEKETDAFRRAVDEQVLLLQENNKREATSKEVDEIANELATKVITDPGFIFDTTKRLFELKPTEDFKEIDPEEIPQSELIKIEDALRRNKIPLTQQNIIDAYSQKLKGTLKRGR